MGNLRYLFGFLSISLIVRWFIALFLSQIPLVLLLILMLGSHTYISIFLLIVIRKGVAEVAISQIPSYIFQPPFQVTMHVIHAFGLIFTTFLDLSAYYHTWFLQPGVMRYVWCYVLVPGSDLSAFALSTITIGLYGLAYCANHQWVDSRLLGGLGIESMTVGLPIDDSGAGRIVQGEIRLV